MDILKEAYNNSYLVITNKVSYKQMMKTRKSDVVFAHNPDSGATKEDLDNMLRYYEGTEEYEKCAEIKEIMDKL